MQRHLDTLELRAQWERNWVRLVWLYGVRLARLSRAGLFMSWAAWQRRRAASAVAGAGMPPEPEEEGGGELEQ